MDPGYSTARKGANTFAFPVSPLEITSRKLVLELVVGDGYPYYMFLPQLVLIASFAGGGEEIFSKEIVKNNLCPKGLIYLGMCGFL